MAFAAASALFCHLANRTIGLSRNAHHRSTRAHGRGESTMTWAID